jgi:predicted phosphodiesterase
MTTKIRTLMLGVSVTLITGCAGSSDEAMTAFQHDITGEALPWTHDQPDASSDRFTFALFSDLTGGERERVFEIAVAQLNLLRPELIINVGDLIEGDSDDPAGAAAEWDSFDERADRARAPLFYVGGNHDLTSPMLKAVWDERYGRRYYHFRYKDVLFLVLDTEDNTPERMLEIMEARQEALRIVAAQGAAAAESTEYFGMPEQAAGNVGPEQSEYFLQVLEENADVRWTFLFMHKAPWERVDEPNFAAIERALTDRPYTVFHGHVHAYEYLERHGRDYIQLATTGGAQLPDRGRSADHVTLVSVSDEGVEIANLLMTGILDKTGHVPLGGDEVCFEIAVCGEDG